MELGVGIDNAICMALAVVPAGTGNIGGKVVRNKHYEGSNSGRGLPDAPMASALTRYRGYHRAWPLLAVMAVYASLSVEAIAQDGVATDRAALIALYDATGGDNWERNYNTNWLSSLTVGEWAGVTTDDDGRVTHLGLNGGNLTGPIPPELGTMAHLENLDLRFNNLTGPIPPELGNLTNLEYLFLFNNNLTGPIPPELGNLTNLESLALHNNNLTGPLPAEFVNLVNLRELTILRNNGLCAPSDATFRTWLATVRNFSGDVCSEDRDALIALYNATGGDNWERNYNTNWLSSLTVGEWAGVTTDDDGRVTHLGLNGGNLTGPIPPELGTMAHLENLDLRFNNLTGPIPPELGNLTNLEYLFLFNNNLTGPIPPELGNLTNLESLALHNNNLTGPLPAEFVNLVNLRELTILRNNGLCAPSDATFRTWLATVRNFGGDVCSEDRDALIALYNATGGDNWERNYNTNWLSSLTVGEWAGVTTDDDGRVTHLGLNGGNLTGPIPPELGTMAHLENLDLRFNNLTGPIPPELGNLTNLEYLFLFNTNLMGSIPPELGNLKNLKWLRIHAANLTGQIPPELGNLHSLVALSLGRNYLTGPIPPDLGNLTNLKTLYLQNNNLTGPIPPELGALTNLYTLSLDGNNLTGPIPPELGNLTKILEMSLADNNLTGPVPAELGNLTNMLQLWINNNKLTGPLPLSITNMRAIVDFRMHNNAGLCLPTSFEFRGWRASIRFAGDTCAAGTESFSIPNLGGWSTTSNGTETTTQTGYGRIRADGVRGTSPAGIAIIGYSPGGTLISEAGIPATETVRQGRIFAEVNDRVNTGLAIANPNGDPATIDFYFTGIDGERFGEDRFVLGPHKQTARFLNQTPFNGGDAISGTVTFTSSLPIAVIALRGLTNRDGEFLMTTLPVAPLASGSTASSDTVYFPHFADGSGWATQVILVNPTDETIAGTVEFLGQGSATTAAAPAVRTLEDGRTGSSFEYSIPPNGSYRIVTSNPPGAPSVGSVRAIPDNGHRAPSGLVIFSFTSAGKTVLEAGVPALPAGSAFRVYVESSGMPEQTGSIRTGLAITNAADTANTVTLEVTDLDGTLAADPYTLPLPPSGQVAKFIDEFFDSLPENFSGVLRVTSTADVAIVGLRLRYNDRGELKMTTTPPSNETDPPTKAYLYFPHIVDSAWWSTQFILFNRFAGQTSYGALSFIDADGESWILPTTQP